VPRSNTVTIDAHAAATLRYIRASMERAGSVAVPGFAGVVMGLIGLGAAVAASMTTLRAHALLVWLAAAPVAALGGAIVMARQFALQGSVWGAPVRKLLLCLLPSLFAGAIITAVHWQAGNLHAIPGTWLLLYGCALICASAPTARIVAVLGALFVLLGLATLLLPDRWHNLALAAGFGGLHLTFGVLIARERHGNQS
jgi:hypothetical protein